MDVIRQNEVRGHADVVNRFERVKEKMKGIREAQLVVKDDRFVVTDFLAHKPITIIYGTFDIWQLELWVEGFIAHRAIHDHLKNIKQWKD